MDNTTRSCDNELARFIQIKGAYAFVASDVMEVIAPCLRYFVHEVNSGGENGYRQRRVMGSVFKVGSDGMLSFPTGCVQIVVERLSQLGYDVHVDDRREFGEAHKHHPHSMLLDEITDHDRHFLETVDQAHRGLIQTSNEEELIHYTGLLCRYYNQARKLLLVSNRTERDKHYNSLRFPLRSQIERDATNWNFPKVGCLIRPYPRIVNGDNWDVIIHLDAECAIAPKRMDNWARLGEQKIFGFLRREMSDNRQEQLLLHQVCGPVLYPELPPKHVVRVLWCEPPHRPPVARNLSALERKRTTIWHDDARNQFIANIADILVRGDHVALLQHASLFDHTCPPDLPAKPRVTILVEAPEHGRQLAKRLDSWRLLVQGDQIGFDGIDKAILTTTRAKQLPNLETDILIRADGTPWPLHLKGFPSNGPGETLLVDIADDFDGEAKQATDDRCVHYLNRNWIATGTPHFLSRR